MLKRLAGLALLASLIGTTTATAQGARWGVGGSGLVSLETGGGSDFGFTGLFDYYPGGKLGYRVDGSWIFETGTDDLLFNADATYNFVTGSPSVHPFIMGGGTVAALTNFDDANVGVNVGAGINFHLRNSPLGLWADGRYHHLFSPSFNGLQFTAGVRLGKGE